MSSLSRSTKILIGVIVLCLAGIVVVRLVHTDKSGTYVPVFQGDQEQAEAVIIKFGAYLNDVPLAGEPDLVAAAIEKAYAPYITEALLDRWMKDPTQAPGRQTSSPWPDRIEVVSIQKFDSYYEAVGKVYYMTSVEEAKGGYSGTETVYITVANTNGSWRIADYQTSME